MKSRIELRLEAFNYNEKSSYSAHKNVAIGKMGKRLVQKFTRIGRFLHECAKSYTKLTKKICVYCKALKFDKVSNGIHLFVIGSCLLASIRQCSRLQLEQTKAQKGLKISAILYFWWPQLHPSSVAMQISLKQMQTSTILCIHFEYYLWISIKYLWTMMIDKGISNSSRSYIVPQSQRQISERKSTEARCNMRKQQGRSLIY